MMITGIDTVHFSSRFPNEAITTDPPTGFLPRAHFRLHHYLVSPRMYRIDEERRAYMHDSAFSNGFEDRANKIDSAEGSIISLKVHEYSFDMRDHIEMAPVFRMMGGIPSGIALFEPRQ
jgi:hypothetical protein